MKFSKQLPNKVFNGCVLVRICSCWRELIYLFKMASGSHVQLLIFLAISWQFILYTKSTFGTCHHKKTVNFDQFGDNFLQQISYPSHLQDFTLKTSRMMWLWLSTMVKAKTKNIICTCVKEDMQLFSLYELQSWIMSNSSNQVWKPFCMRPLTKLLQIPQVYHNGFAMFIAKPAAAKRNSTMIFCYIRLELAGFTFSKISISDFHFASILFFIASYTITDSIWLGEGRWTAAAIRFICS